MRARCWTAFLFYLACVVSLAGQAEADDVGCGERYSSDWTETEWAAWRSLTQGQTFDAQEYAPVNKKNRAIGAAFIRNILICRELSDQLSWRGLDFKGAIVPTVLDLSLLDITVRVSCRYCLLQRLEAHETTWRKSLDLSGSVLRDGLDFVLARVEDEFRAEKLRTDADIRLDRASIGRNANLAEIRSKRRLSMQDVHVGQKLRLDGAQVASLDLGGARVGGQLVLNGISVGRKAYLDRMRIDGHLLLRSRPDGLKPEIGGAYSPEELQSLAERRDYILNLNSTKIGGRLEIAHADIKGPATLDAIRVAEDIWLRDCSRVAGHIQMPFARIGQNLDLSTTQLRSIDATGSTIAGELRMGAAGSDRLTPPLWHSSGWITLRNVTVSAWVDSAD